MPKSPKKSFRDRGVRVQIQNGNESIIVLVSVQKGNCFQKGSPFSPQISRKLSFVVFEKILDPKNIE